MALAGQPPTALAPTSVGREPVRRGAKWGALTAVSLATFAVLIDFMAVSLALPHIRASFDATFSELQSVVEAFVVCLAACILGAGYVADRFGRLRAFTAGLTLFGLGALVSGVAPSIYALIAGRVVEGVGGALLLATGALLVAEIYGHKRERAALAIWGTVTGAAVVISPVVGSAITSYLGWRWIFVLEAALAGIAVVTTMVTVQEPSLDRTRTPSADWRGLALFATAVAVLVTGLVRTTTALGGWAQSGVLACFACSGLLLIAFIAVEAVSPAPVLDLSLFRLRTFTGSAVAAFGLSMAVLGPLIFLVLYLSYGLGFSTMSIGAHLLLLSGMTLPLLPLAWWLDKYIPVKVLLSGGLTCVAVGLWLLSRLPSLPTLSDLTPGLVMMGVGLELLNPRLASTAAAPVGTQLAAPASRANSTFRWVGTAIGVAVVGSVFATRLSDDITSRIAGSSQLSGQGPQLAGLALEGRTRLMVGSAPSDYRSVMLGIVRESFSDAMHEAFVVAAGVALASAVVALCIRSRDLPGHGARTSAATVPALVVAIPRAVPAPAPLAPLPPAPAELVGGPIGDVSQVAVPAFKAVPAVPVGQVVPAVPPTAGNAADNATEASEGPEM
ncbi:MAG TPA: MFS transporter, partial [Acidimicrobiales bacterium]|nr:MFS transporter [Acidimicrobiales bacterium]